MALDPWVFDEAVIPVAAATLATVMPVEAAADTPFDAVELTPSCV